MEVFPPLTISPPLDGENPGKVLVPGRPEVAEDPIPSIPSISSIQERGLLSSLESPFVTTPPLDGAMSVRPKPEKTDPPCLEAEIPDEEDPEFPP